MAELFKNIISSFGVADWVIIIMVCLLILLLLVKHAKPNIQKLTARDDVRGYSLIYADQKQGKRGFRARSSAARPILQKKHMHHKH